MTAHTEELIKSFSKSLDVNALPGIIVALQEEDNVSNVIDFKNCFRQLRNIAAHEPATIVSQIAVADNVNNTKLVFYAENDNVVVMDTIQFTAWMFNMYILTKNIAYLAFWKAFMKLVYPAIPVAEAVVQDTLQFSDASSEMLDNYDKWQTFMFDRYKVMQTINTRDPYITTMFRENRKVFWRMAIPDMFMLVRCYVDGSVSLRRTENIVAFLALYKARE